MSYFEIKKEILTCHKI